jgi:hypothetical protein
MKWRVLLGLSVTMLACARDSSPPATQLRDAAGDDDPEATPEDPPPAKDDDGGAGTGTPPPPDASVDPEPAEDAGTGAPACTGTEPDSSVDVSGATFSAVSVNRRGNVVSVAPGATVSVTFDYALSIDACAAVALPTVSPRVGFAEGATACTPTGTLCVAIIPGTSGTNDATLSLTAPSEPGEYGIYGALEHGTTFNGGECAPYDGPPDESRRIATICVE